MALKPLTVDERKEIPNLSFDVKMLKISAFEMLLLKRIDFMKKN